MLTAGGIRNACPSCRARLTSLTGKVLAGASPAGLAARSSFAQQSSPATLGSLKKPTTRRAFSTTPRRLKDTEPARDETEGLARNAKVEKTVREAKQRFRDTLPKGYLTEEEYSLYERWYGPPLRETTPDDVGMQYLNDKHSAKPRRDGSGGPTLFRETEGGTLQEVQYVSKKTVRTPSDDEAASTETEAPEEEAPDAAATDEGVPEGDGKYINIVARNKREYDALMKLQKDFEENSRAVEESVRNHLEEEELRDEEREFEEEEDEEELDEGEDGIAEQQTSMRAGRLHPFTREGHFSTNPSTVSLPHVGYVSPVSTILDRTDIKHVKEAAEKAFGGPGLPYSPATPASKMGLEQQPLGMAAWQHKMSEIEADAFVSSFLPPAYASSMGTLVEVRKRLGTDWLRKLFEKPGGPRFLDVGAGGAGLLAWQDITRAEWEAMRSRGEVENKNPRESSPWSLVPTS
ncbi:37s ribosomal protein rsm22 [Colletotrichum higginsianum]|nr:37s ribosomal protein rsm22 [Colletotrichum higginsianum]